MRTALRISHEWHHFYPKPLRRAVIRTVIEEIKSSIEISKADMFGLKIGKQSFEDISFKESTSKLQYGREWWKRNRCN